MAARSRGLGFFDWKPVLNGSAIGAVFHLRMAAVEGRD